MYKKIHCVIFCKSTNCHLYNIFTKLTLNYLVKNIVLFDFSTSLRPYD